MAKAGDTERDIGEGLNAGCGQVTVMWHLLLIACLHVLNAGVPAYYQL